MADKTSKQRAEAARRLYESARMTFALRTATLITSFIGYMTIIYFIVQLIIKISNG
jgi:hypothetical protein